MLTIILVLLLVMDTCVRWYARAAERLYMQRAPHYFLRRARPDNRRRPKPAWVLDAIVALKARLPAAGCRTLAHLFNRRHAPRMTISKSCVADIVRRHRYQIENQRRHFRQQSPRAVPRNAVWGIDFTGKQDGNGQQHSVLGIIDHSTRRLLTLIAVPNRSSWTLLGHLCLTISRYGKPRSIRTDNEGTFTSTLVTTMLLALSLPHRRTQPGSPWQNGRIERLFGTLKQGLNQLAIHDVAQLRIVLNQFCNWYNTERPHDNLGGATPEEIWYGLAPQHDVRRQ